MIRAVLDTNVLVSAFLKPAGPPGRIRAMAVEGRFEVALSAPMIAELIDVLHRPSLRRVARFEPEDIADFIETLIDAAHVHEGDLPAGPFVPDDPKDDKVVGTAIAAGADVIVSGDSHLLSLGICGGIPIVDVRGFLEARLAPP